MLRMWTSSVGMRGSGACVGLRAMGKKIRLETTFGKKKEEEEEAAAAAAAAAATGTAAVAAGKEGGGGEEEESDMVVIAEASKRSWLLEGAGYWALMQVTGATALAPLILMYEPQGDVAAGLEPLANMGMAGRGGVAGMLVAFAGSILYGVRAYAGRYVDQVLVPRPQLEGWLEEGKPIRTLGFKTLTLLGRPKVTELAVSGMSMELVRGNKEHEAMIKDLTGKKESEDEEDEGEGKMKGYRRVLAYRTRDPRVTGPLIVDFDGGMRYNDLAFDLLVKSKLVDMSKVDHRRYCEDAVVAEDGEGEGEGEGEKK